MADIESNRAEMKLFLKSLQLPEGDSKAESKDYFEKHKHQEWWELQGGRLKFYETGKPENNTTTTVVEVQKRRGTNILILRCGPGGRMIHFLEFDSKKSTDEWQEALCKSIGQEHAPNPALRRSESERKEIPRKHRKARTQSACPDILESEQDDSDSKHDLIEDPREAPSEAPSKASSEAQLEAPSEAPSKASSEAQLEAPSEVSAKAPSEAQLEAPQKAAEPAEQVDEFQGVQITGSGMGETDDSDDSQNTSPPHSLRSRDAEINQTLEEIAKISLKKECFIVDLQQLKIMDYKGDVIVNEPLPQCQLHVGDIVVVTNTEGLPMNARQVTEHIRTTAEQTITLTVMRGPVCTVRKEEEETVINIKESQTVRPDAVDEIMKACTSTCSLVNADTPETSTLVITEINNIPLDFSSQADQTAEKIREALQNSKGHLTLRLVPQSLLDALAEEDNDVDDEHAPDVVDK